MQDALRKYSNSRDYSYFLVLATDELCVFLQLILIAQHFAHQYVKSDNTLMSFCHVRKVYIKTR